MDKTTRADARRELAQGVLFAGITAALVMIVCYALRHPAAPFVELIAWVCLGVGGSLKFMERIR